MPRPTFHSSQLSGQLVYFCEPKWYRLYSIVQMPRGIPVATVAINNSTNAALLAVRIIGAADAEVLQRMQSYMEDMESEVMGKVGRLQEQGWDYVVKK